jgi:hypothetical protein
MTDRGSCAPPASNYEAACTARTERLAACAEALTAAELPAIADLLVAKGEAVAKLILTTARRYPRDIPGLVGVLDELCDEAERLLELVRHA